MTRALGMLLGALFVAALLSTQAPSVRADAVIEASSVDNGYPKQLTFKVTARSDADITDVSLAYSITGRGTSALGKPASPPAGKNVTVEVVLQVNSGASYIPVGSEFVYHWELTSADGKTVSGPEQTFFFLPPNQDWKSVKGEFMTVYYHGDKEALANSYLKAGVETYDKIGKTLFSVTLKQIPVKVILFDNEKESDLSRPGAGAGSFDAAVTTCGTKVTNDIILLIPVECGSTDRTDTLRHEFGHILNQTAGEGSLAKLPSWLDEGTAVFAQLGPGDYQTAFAQAARDKKLIPFSEMATPTSDARKVGIFYGEAYNMVKFLVEKGGPAKYGEFFATMKRGQRFDQALKTIYGFDMTGFEAEFLAAQGSSAPRATVAPTQRPQQVQPTAAPTKAPPVAQSQGAKSDGGGISTTSKVVVGVAMLFALLAVLSFLMLQMMSNNRKRAALASSPPSPDSTGTGPDDA
ncbi:MAG: peptidase MA family metallohydrolase [Anaerolineaceae bacterium]